MTDNEMLYQTAFRKKLEQLGIACRLENDGIYFCWQSLACCLRYSARNNLELRALRLATVAPTQLLQAYKSCNKLNTEFNWLKFSINKHNELECMVTSAVNADDVVEESLELLERLTQAVRSRDVQLSEGGVRPLC